MKKFFYALSLFGIFFIFVPILPVSAANDYCIWSPILNGAPKAGENVCNFSGLQNQYFIQDSTKASCAGKTKTSIDTICCCQILDRPGQCNIKNTCPAGESCINGLCRTTTATANNESSALFTPPDFQVKIPGMKALTTVSCNEGNLCEIPWLGQYVVGLYGYALSIAGILAAIMLMAGGLIWLISAGDASKITQAKDIIIGSITGLVILAASFIILTQVNPDLISMKSISVTSIKKIVLNDADVTIIGGENPYATACAAAKKGDYSICKALGNSQPSTLIDLENVKVDAQVAEKYLDAMECVKLKNGKYLFSINEAWRSAAKQLDYYNQGKSTATPCCSNHGSGKALDLNRNGGQMSWEYNDSSGLTACMNAQGLYAKLNDGKWDEPWHWSLTGK